MAELGTALSELAEHCGAFERVAHDGHRLVVGNLSIEHRKRMVAVAAGADADLVVARLPADLLAPLIGIDPVGELTCPRRSSSA